MSKNITSSTGGANLDYMFGGFDQDNSDTEVQIQKVVSPSKDQDGKESKKLKKKKNKKNKNKRIAEE